MRIPPTAGLVIGVVALVVASLNWHDTVTALALGAAFLALTPEVDPRWGWGTAALLLVLAPLMAMLGADALSEALARAAFFALVLAVGLELRRWLSSRDRG